MIKSIKKEDCMKKINFNLIKNNEIIIDEKSLNSIQNNNKISFIIDGIKYSYQNNIFTKETKEEVIELDFKEEICKITLKEYNNFLNLKLDVINIKDNDKITKVEYKIETEEDVVNIINIEYV